MKMYTNAAIAAALMLASLQPWTLAAVIASDSRLESPCDPSSSSNIGSSSIQQAQMPFLASADQSCNQTLQASTTKKKGKGKDKANEGWIFLIRHGEKFKNTEKTGLSERGVKRANCLREVFGTSKHGIKHILAQDYKPDGRRRRPYETVKPLSRAIKVPIDHHCDRDDIKCAAKYIRERVQPHNDRKASSGGAGDSATSDALAIDEASRRGDNVLVCWEHARLSDIARHLGVKGLHYPSHRYDLVFKVRHGKVHAIYSEECNGLDEEWMSWRAKRMGKHGKGGHGGRLIDDESWADPLDDDDDDYDDDDDE